MEQAKRTETLDAARGAAAVMAELGRRARKASRSVALASRKAKDDALRAAAAAIRQAAPAILAANALDAADAEARGATAAFLDRLTLDADRIEAMARGMEEIAALADPVGRVLAVYERPNGLRIERVSTPLGVIGVIYESRPNVTADAGALCLKSGNAAILRCGSESLRSSIAIHQCLVAGLASANLPEAAISLAPTAERAAVGAMLAGLDGNIDVIVPRGGKSLVARVQHDARVPVFAHLEGLVHVFVHADADLDMAKRIVLNAKMRRTGICGAAETLLVDRACAATHLTPLVASLLDSGCEVRGDEATRACDPRVKPAGAEDWRTEYLDAIITVGVVDGLDAAIDHIESYGSHHTDAIVTRNEAVARRFLAEVDSAIVLHNASTQFADGGEFGFGAEIGIATGRMHARGPVGVEQLTSFKYRVHGAGQVRG
ncbi:MAG: glutamate-5-semialdehyde dehydrogenase [Methylocystis sp.]|nr:glutamate-5-semialdehyde dehydrogenase [Methylocystis sp.]